MLFNEYHVSMYADFRTIKRGVDDNYLNELL